VLRLVQVPKHGGSILATGGAERSIWGDGNSVNVTSVSDVIGLDSARRKLPDLDKLVPSRADNNWVLRVWAESYARDPIGVSLLGDSELAITKSVPELDGSVAGSGNDLSVVGGEGDGENIVGVSNESSGGGTGGELPKAESLVPRGRESIGTVRGDNAVGNDVRVTVKRSLWVTVRGIVAGQVPDDQGLVAGT